MAIFEKGGLFVLLLVFYIGWIFVATGTETRLERTCKPITWIGNAISSVVELTIPDYTEAFIKGTISVEGSCRYVAKKTIYEVNNI